MYPTTADRSAEFKASVGGRLREARKAADFTLEGAASHLGISRQAVVSWEAGNSLPSPEHLANLAVRYGVSVDWIFGGEAELTVDERAVLRFYRTMNGDHRGLIRVVRKLS